MKNIYILSERGASILGLFSTYEKAEEFKNKYYSNLRCTIVSELLDPS